MAITNDSIKAKLAAKFGDAISDVVEPYGMLTFTIAATQNLKALQFLKEDAELGLDFLTDLQAVHYPDRVGQELCVVYHLHNMRQNVRVRMKLFVPIEKPDVFTATSLYACANWMERETYDFFGVNFLGHPDLRRILNVDEMDYFPMRKEFPLEDQTRTDKDDEMFGRG
jgi:NADH-quinone oxidoreductase subunit C